MSEIIQDYDEYTLSDFLPENMDVINRGEVRDPLTLEIVNRVNWHTVVDVHGDSRDAKLVMKALVSYDANQALISKQAEQIKMHNNQIAKMLMLHKQSSLGGDSSVDALFELADFIESLESTKYSV